MNRATIQPLKLSAAILSIAINLVLLLAIDTGFASQAAPSLRVVQLPTVTVHGKRLPRAGAAVTAACTPCTSSAHSH
ncbi:hypothetical protein [Rhodoferax sp.]|uniref:hypothetical protein n=1 Tax=Rhodoferax sp. TaxID=50421 RepID=UPI002638878F|nr:hypothetical protein [Rhodoferax sp.]MDD2920009.1 hypothetical protein [Rhodoferax sp.]